MQRNEQAQVGGYFMYFTPSIHYVLSFHLPHYVAFSKFGFYRQMRLRATAHFPLCVLLKCEDFPSQNNVEYAESRNSQIEPLE